MNQKAEESNKKQTYFRKWLPVFGFAFSVFIFNTSEFIPIGLLSDIATDFGTTEAQTGFLISAYAWVVAIISLPLMLLCSSVERKKLLIILFSLFIISNIISFLSNSFLVLLISRMSVACAHAVFWAIVPPLAVRLAPDGQRAKALGYVAVGASIAMVLGLPLGRMIGVTFGWRSAFLFIALIALLVTMLLLFILPKLPKEGNESIKSLPSLLKRPSLMGLYALTALTVIGHFTAYSYIEPFIINYNGFNEQFATIILLIYGCSGLIGSYLYSHFGDKHPYRLMMNAVIIIAISMIAMYFTHNNMISLIFVCVFWSIGSLLYNISFQNEILKQAPDATSIATSMYSGTYNFGIGSGALIGGFVCTHLGLGYIGFIGGGIALIATGLCAILIKYYFLKK